MTIGKAKKILRGFLAKDCYYDTPLYYAIPYLLDYITNLQTIEREYSAILSENAELQQELERYKNIIDELEKYIKENTYKDNWDDSVILSKYLLDKIKELKGSDCNE